MDDKLIYCAILYLFLCWWALKLVPLLSYAEQCHNKHWCASISVIYWFRDVRYTLRVDMDESYSRSHFSFVRNSYTDVIRGWTEFFIFPPSVSFLSTSSPGLVIIIIFFFIMMLMASEIEPSLMYTAHLFLIFWEPSVNFIGSIADSVVRFFSCLGFCCCCSLYIRETNPLLDGQHLGYFLLLW